MLLGRGRGSLLAEEAEGAGVSNAGIAGIAEASFAWLAQRASKGSSEADHKRCRNVEALVDRVSLDRLCPAERPGDHANDATPESRSLLA
jgi:hypothetical protein